MITSVLPRGARISVRYTCSKNNARGFRNRYRLKTKRDSQFYTELAVHIVELRSLSQCNRDQRKIRFTSEISPTSVITSVLPRGVRISVR